jgi:CBS domain-containing protein
MALLQTEIRLKKIYDDLVAQKDVEQVTVRQFLGWMGAERRGAWVVWRLSKALERAKLRTVPDFNSVPIDYKIRFAIVTPPVETSSSTLRPGEAGASAAKETVESVPVFISGAASDPAFRIGRLVSANTRPMCVAPDSLLGEAVTLMLRHDFSQLPVMPNERDVKGVVSWESIGSRLALGKTVTTVRECMRAHHEVSSVASLFQVIAQIVAHSYVLVRGEDQTITGIVTTADLSLQFQQLSEPFLLLSEIENHVRLLIDGRFTANELRSVEDSVDPNRQIDSVADLTFGEYIHLLEKPSNWAKTGLTVDRAIFVRELDQVRRIRNDVMHFDPDGITEEDHRLLLHFVQFMHQLRAISG